MEEFVLDELGYKYPKNSNRKMYIVDNSNPYSIENIKNFIKIKDMPIELISEEYVGTLYKLKFKFFCCGNIQEISWHSLKKIKQYNCKECYYKNVHSKDKMLSKSKVLEKFNENGFTLLEEYKNTNKRILVKNQENYIGILSYTDMQSGKKPYYFKKTNPHSIENIKTFLINNNAEYEILSDCFNGYYEKMKWKCKFCEKEFISSWGNVSSRIKRGHFKYCNNCRPKSYNEYLTSKYLKDNNINYKQQYIFEDCKNIKYLPFDFYIPIENICIEVDGEQHFRPTTFGGISEEKSLENFKQQIKRDNIKTKFCKENNIKLIRLSYKDFNNDNYINKLNQLLE